MASAGLTTNLIKRKRNDMMIIEEKEYLTNGKTEVELLRYLRYETFLYELVNELEVSMSAIFGDSCRLNPEVINLEDFKVNAEDDPGQQTVRVSVPIAGKVEEVVKYLLRRRGFTLVPKSTIGKKKSGKKLQDAKCDVSILVLDEWGNEKVMDFEIKTTQGDNFQGSTHSVASGKSLNLILFKYELDYSLPIPTDGSPFLGVFLESHYAVLDARVRMDWKGKPTDGNSRTTGKVVNTPENAKGYGECLVTGGFRTNYVRGDKKLKHLIPTTESLQRLPCGKAGRLQEQPRIGVAA